MLIKKWKDKQEEKLERLARNKYFVKCIFKPKPRYLCESIPVSGNGELTND